MLFDHLEYTILIHNYFVFSPHCQWRYEVFANLFASSFHLTKDPHRGYSNLYYLLWCAVVFEVTIDSWFLVLSFSLFGIRLCGLGLWAWVSSVGILSSRSLLFVLEEGERWVLETIWFQWLCPRNVAVYLFSLSYEVSMIWWQKEISRVLRNLDYIRIVRITSSWWPCISSCTLDYDFSCATLS